MSEAVEDQDARFAIEGAIEYGRQGIKPPPDNHWLAPFWHMGKQLSELASRQPVSQGDGWQDISSAPKDGTAILVSNGRGKMITALWASGQWKLVDYKGSITLWQPLPSPPEGQGS